jgi:hypothetical protein
MSDQSQQPKYEAGEPPASDQEFKFETIDSAPAWIDKGWAGYNNGPALALPADPLGNGYVYSTITARVGDTVKWVAPTPARVGHFEVLEGEPTGDAATVKIPQVTNASLEDMLKTGSMTPDDLGTDAKAQVAARSPHLAKLVEEGKGAPEAIPVTEMVKTA